MSDSSRSKVTITLGRSGQVVKRDGSALDSSSTELHPQVGSKGGILERLGYSVNSSAQGNNKRLRGDGRSANAVSALSKDDLRHKLMKKNILKEGQNGQQNGLDLRNILSRPSQSSTDSIFTLERMSGSKDTTTRLHQMESMGGGQHLADTRDGTHLPSVTRSSSQYIPEFRADNALNLRKRPVLDAMDGGRTFLDAKDVRHHMPEPSKSGMFHNMPGLRPSNSIPRLEPGVNSYSPWTLKRIRQRSPDDSLTVSRSIAPPRRDEVSQRRYAVREYDDARTGTYKDVFDNSRPMNSSHLAKMDPPVGQIKPMAPVGSPRPLPGSLTKKNSYMVDDQHTVDSFLRSLDLEKYALTFRAGEVDMYSLRRMAERDLKVLGIPMGPRKKILLSLHPHLKQQM